MCGLLGFRGFELGPRLLGCRLSSSATWSRRGTAVLMSLRRRWSWRGSFSWTLPTAGARIPALNRDDVCLTCMGRWFGTVAGPRLGDLPIGLFGLGQQARDQLIHGDGAVSGILGWVAHTPAGSTAGRRYRVRRLVRPGTLWSGAPKRGSTRVGSSHYRDRRCAGAGTWR
jgi:hypothetical protein